MVGRVEIRSEGEESKAPVACDVMAAPDAEPVGLGLESPKKLGEPCGAKLPDGAGSLVSGGDAAADPIEGGATPSASKISLGSSTLDTPNTATGFWSNTVRVTVACTIPVSMATEPLTLDMLSVYLPAPESSVASVGCTGLTMLSSDPSG